MARQLATESGCSLKDFCHHKPDSFYRKGDHISAENWLNDMEELLNLIGCTEGQKVMYIAYKLLGEAKRWWEVERNLLVMELGAESAITWTRFKKEFDNQNFPQIVREAKAQEFMDLVQGSMTVAQYAAKFIQLSRFALYVILDEEKKAKKFERGLN